MHRANENRQSGSKAGRQAPVVGGGEDAINRQIQGSQGVLVNKSWSVEGKNKEEKGEVYRI